MLQEINVHSSIEFKVIAIYPSFEHKDKIAILVAYSNGEQKVLYINN